MLMSIIHKTWEVAALINKVNQAEAYKSISSNNRENGIVIIHHGLFVLIFIAAARLSVCRPTWRG